MVTRVDMMVGESATAVVPKDQAGLAFWGHCSQAGRRSRSFRIFCGTWNTSRVKPEMFSACATAWLTIESSCYTRFLRRPSPGAERFSGFFIWLMSITCMRRACSVNDGFRRGMPHTQVVCFSPYPWGWTLEHASCFCGATRSPAHAGLAPAVIAGAFCVYASGWAACPRAGCGNPGGPRWRRR